MNSDDVPKYKEWLAEKINDIRRYNTDNERFIDIKFREASKKGLVNVCKMLLEEYEIDIDTLNYCLVRQNIPSANMTKLLLEAGADPDTTNKQGNTLLMIFSDIEVMEVLINARANPFIVNKYGNIAIDYYDYNSYDNIIKRQILRNYMNEWLMDEFSGVGSRGQYLPEDLLSKIGNYL